MALPLSQSVSQSSVTTTEHIDKLLEVYLSLRDGERIEGTSNGMRRVMLIIFVGGHFNNSLSGYTRTQCLSWK